MSDTQNTTQKIIELVQRYKSGVIVMQANPSLDGAAAATALYLALSKAGKHVSLVCANPPQQMDLVATDKIQNTFASGGNHLVISFPYVEGTIDKVDYNITGETFNLIIIPNSDTSKIDPKEVKFSYTGGKIEFIITVDAPNLNSLGQVYNDNQNEFQSKNVINIDRHLINNSFGTVNLVNKQASSTSEMILQIIRDMNIELDKDIATNLYTGILSATNNFSSYSVNPTTFEAAAFLMKHGAVKKQIPGAKNPGMPGGMPPAAQGGFAPPAFPSRAPSPFSFMNQNQAPQEDAPAPFQPPMPSPQNMAPQNMPQMNQPMNQMPVNPMGVPQSNQPQQQQEQSQDPQQQNKNPQDWLKPKLFRGNNLM
jgi:hypothetical protein